MNEVRDVRRRAGLSQAELAHRSGVAQPNIAAYESGRRKASKAMVQRLRDAARPRPSEVVRAHRDDILEVADRHGMREVRLFGSVIRGDDSPESDLDILVSPPDGAGLFAVSSFALELEDLLGVKVDVVTTGGLKPGHRILQTAQPL